MTVTGIDMQGRITNWPKVKTLGHSFAVTRVIGENGALDPDAVPNIKGARAAGLVAGGYHFIAHGTAVEHCKLFKDAIAPFIESGPFLVQLDAEKPNFHPIPTMADIAAWFDEFRKDYPDHPVFAYIPEWFIDDYLGGTRKLAALTPLWWNSRYVTGDIPQEIAEGWTRSAGGWTAPTLWQYHGTTAIGAGADVDLNITRLTLAQLRALGSPGPALPESDTVGELLMDFEFKGERFKPNATHPDGAPYRAAPDRSLAGIGTITDTFRSGAEIVDGSGQAWRATKKNGQTVFILRADLDPIVLGGEPAVDADLDNFFAGVVQDCSDEVTAERKRIAAAEAARIEAI